MIIPIRCWSCGKPIAHLWEEYVERVGAGEDRKKVMDELGISFVDSSGRLKPFVSIIRDLQKAGMTASQAMQMFGLRAGPGMIALVNAGANSIRDLQSSLEGAQGAAERMSQALLIFYHYTVESVPLHCEGCLFLGEKVHLVEGRFTGRGLTRHVDVPVRHPQLPVPSSSRPRRAPSGCRHLRRSPALRRPGCPPGGPRPRRPSACR